MDLSKIMKASMEYVRCKDDILMNHVVNTGRDEFMTYRDEVELADKIIRLINAVDKMIESL